MAIVEEIMRGEEGYNDLGRPVAPAPVRIISKPRTPAEDRAALDQLASDIEILLKESRRKIAPEPGRSAEIDRTLKAKVCGILGEVVSCRRKATGVIRSAADQFQSVQEIRKLYLSIGRSSHEELMQRAAAALELYRSECQNESETTI